uniref:Uncharacterized protein n=1 Tax=Rhizophora mucronata TaxID=61149 RepID=A0A2P2QV15_RHIMU
MYYFLSQKIADRYKFEKRKSF